MTTVALLQLDPTVGDIASNVAEIERAVTLAASEGADMAVASELVVSGYPPRDMLMDKDFVQRCCDAAHKINSPIPLMIGCPIPSGKEKSRPYNGVIRVSEGRKARIVGRKQLLPTYDVFDEGRYFQADDTPGIDRSLPGLSVGITICEDAWQHAGEVPADYGSDPIEQLAAWQHQGEPLALTVNLSSSPYHLAKEGVRAKIARKAAQTLEHPFLLCNQVGGNDDLLFDGRSLIAFPDGTVVQAPGWCQGVFLVDLDDPAGARWLPWPDGECGDGCRCSVQMVGEGELPLMPPIGADLLCAITVGLGDYCRKSGIERMVLGMSGGIDSAVCAAVACRAVGAENVLGLAMPSRYSSIHSLRDAKATADALGMEFQTISIADLHTAAEAALAYELDPNGSTEGGAIAGEMIARPGAEVAAENVQARLRGMLIMAAANSRNSMALATGNKSELAMGYCTLYGDMCGGYAPLGDLYKKEVYDLAHAINADAESMGNPPPITESTLTKPPSAELAPDQTDQDSLPPYEILDEILEDFIERNIRNTNHPAELVDSILARLHANEHKRWQMPPAPRVSNRAFGQGWRQPLASRR